MSTESVSTRGIYDAGGGGGGGGGVVTITAVSPTPNTAPGAIGGMPIDYTLAKDTPIVVDVTNSSGAASLAYIQIMALYLDGTFEVVVRNGSFVNAYQKFSTFDNLSLGYEYSIRRTIGWPGQVGNGGNLAVGLLVDVVDGGGNLTSTSFFYEMPQQSIGMAAPIITLPIPTAADIAGEARSLLVWQFKSA